LSISQIEQQVKLSSDIIRSVTINSIRINGREIALKDFAPSSARQYLVAGNVNVNSVIIGTSSY
jgi:hypothetical protein